MEEILKMLLFAHHPTEAHFLHLKEQQMFNTYVIYLTVTKTTVFPKLSEIYFYCKTWKMSRNKEDLRS